MTYTREELIGICKDAVVPFQKWGDRDSYCSQLKISDIYSGLMAGINFETKLDGDTIWIHFVKPTDDQRKELINHYLPIGSLQDYFNEFGYDDEMFDGDGISWDSSYLGAYMPTREKLIECNGNDWY